MSALGEASLSEMNIYGHDGKSPVHISLVTSAMEATLGAEQKRQCPLSGSLASLTQPSRLRMLPLGWFLRDHLGSCSHSHLKYN